MDFNEHTDMDNPQLKVGMMFSTAQVFRRAVVEYNVKGGYEIRYLKNKNARITAACKNPQCKWRIHASPFNKVTFMIKSLTAEHTCSRSYTSHLLDSRYIMRVLLYSYKGFIYCT